MAVSKFIGISRNSDQLRKIRYTARDFIGLKNEMNTIIASYFPETSSDFSEGSGSQVLVELIAFVTDVISFYTDKQFNELILERAFEEKNIYGLAKGLGYQPRTVRPSIANLNFQVDIPVTGSLTANYFFNISSAATFKTRQPANVLFETIEPIIFNNETASLFNPTIVTRNDNITVTRLFLQNVKVISGKTDTFTHSFDNSIGIKKLHIPESRNTNSIISVIDSEGNEWYEVKSLSQENIFTGVPNLDASDTSEVPFLLTMKRVPRRFVVEYNNDGSVDLVFGSGDIDLNDTEFILNPDYLVFPNKTQGKFLNFNSDSLTLEDLPASTSLGVAPQNINVIVTYRTGGGTDHNIGRNLITNIENIDFNYYSINISADTDTFIRNSIVITNPEPSQGGNDAETIDQIKVNAPFWYAAQDRVVSISDYIARVASIPVQYGSVYKLTARHGKNQAYDTINLLTSEVTQLVNQRKTGVEDNILLQRIINLNEKIKNTSSDVILNILSRNSSGFLEKPTTTLKKNILTYINQYKMISDVIEIQDVKIINLGCRFSLNVDTRQFNPGEVLLETLDLIRDYLSTSNMDIGKNINVDEIRATILNNIDGVVSIPELYFMLINGTTNDGRIYSNDYLGEIQQFLSHSGTIVQCPNDAIFEIKYPLMDVIAKFDN